MALAAGTMDGGIPSPLSLYPSAPPLCSPSPAGDIHGEQQASGEICRSRNHPASSVRRNKFPAICMGSIWKVAKSAGHCRLPRRAHKRAFPVLVWSSRCSARSVGSSWHPVRYMGNHMRTAMSVGRSRAAARFGTRRARRREPRCYFQKRWLHSDCREPMSGR